MGLVPDSETKPAAEKVGEEPKQRCLKRRERPPNTDPKVEEEIDKICAEEGISFPQTEHRQQILYLLMFRRKEKTKLLSCWKKE